MDISAPLAALSAGLTDLRGAQPVGRIARIGDGALTIGGLGAHARLGAEIVLEVQGDAPLRAEIVAIDGTEIRAVPLGVLDGLGPGAAATLAAPAGLEVCDGWLGRVIDPLGRPLDGRPLPRGAARPVDAPPPPPASRRALGPRCATGYPVLDTMLPLAAGQRIGLFAGAGVGKSTLLGGLVRRTACDVAVVALLGERGREVGEMVRHVLGPAGMARTVVVAATADRPAGLRRRAAPAAMAVAEHFRDRGRRVLLVCDSLTRFAEAHREIAAAGGEALALRGHPSSLVPRLSALVERAGPGAAGQGDITAVFTVLAAGSDMEEPVADILRGQLDGHVVLSREIAEAGRYPAVDVLRSASRSLPAAASAAENALLAETRAILATQARNAMMVTSGLYVRGSDPDLDRAIAVAPRIEALFATDEATTPEAAFAALAGLLGRAPPDPPSDPPPDPPNDRPDAANADVDVADR